MAYTLDGIKRISLELMIFGAGTVFGLGDSLRQKDGLNILTYFTNGLYGALPAAIVSYGVSGKLEKSITRIGFPLYTGHLVGQTIGELIKRNYM